METPRRGSKQLVEAPRGLSFNKSATLEFFESLEAVLGPVFGGTCSQERVNVKAKALLVFESTEEFLSF